MLNSYNKCSKTKVSKTKVTIYINTKMFTLLIEQNISINSYTHT